MHFQDTSFIALATQESMPVTYPNFHWTTLTMYEQIDSVSVRLAYVIFTSFLTAA